MEFTDKVKELFGFKERPAFEKTAPATWPTYPLLTPWVMNRDVGNIDYKAEVGDLSNSSLVMAVVNWTGTQFTEAPIVVKTPGKKNEVQVDLGNPAADLLANPNPFDVFDDYCGVMSLDWWIPGNHYWYKARDGAGKVIELWYLPSFMVEPRWPGDGASPEARGPKDAFISHYQYSVPGKDPVLYPAKDIVHIKRSVDPMNRRKGIGAFGSVVREIYGDNAIGALTATLMRNMGIVPYVISPKEAQILTPTDAEAIKDQFLVKTRGQNLGQPIVNAIPMDITKLGLDPSQLDLSKLRMIPESRVSAVTGIPAAMLQFMVGLENGTSFAAYREARQQGYESVVIPIQRTIARQLTRKLLPEFDTTKGAVYEFDVSQVRVLQEDRDALYKRATLALMSGGISRNQFAASLSKPPPDKEEIYYVPSTVKPMTQELIEETAAEKVEPVAPLQPPDPDALAKFANLERWFEGLEKEMREFSQK